MNRRRRVVSACIAVVVVGALGACSSTPGNRRVVSDVIESLQLPEEQEACMMERLEGYTDDQLKQIADDNETWDPAEQGDTPADASEGMRLFIRDFQACTQEGGPPPESSVPGEVTGTTEPTGTDAADSTAPTESTTPTAFTGPSGSTTPAETTEG